MSDLETGRETKIKDISFILKDLLKVIKVVYMYPEDNPLPQSLRRSFSEKLVSVIEQYGDIKVKVAKEELTHDGEVVFKDKSKEEALAGIFFETGITQFTFESSMDVGDVYKLLDVFKAYLNSPSRSYDIVSGFWEAQIVGFKFRTVEDIALAEYDGNFDFQAYLSGDSCAPNSDSYDSGRITTSDYNKIFHGHVDLDALDTAASENNSEISKKGKPGQRPATKEELLFYASTFANMPDIEDDGDSGADGGAQGGDDIAEHAAVAAEIFGFSESEPSGPSRPNTTIILNDELRFSEEEEERIKEMVTEDAYFEPYESTVELLKEMLLQESELPQFSETVTICEKIMVEFMEMGRLMEVSQIIAYLGSLKEKLRQERPIWVERIKEAEIAAGSRERLKLLRDTLNCHPDLGAGLLRKYLSNFGWEALSGITEIMNSVQHERHRDTICDHLAEFGKENLHIIAGGVGDKNSDVVKNSVSVLTRIQDDRIYGYLSKAMQHESTEVRMHVVESLSDISSKKAVDLLAKLARDRDSEIRRRAVQALGNVSGAHGFNIIADIINDNSFVMIEDSEQQLLLNTLSRLGGDDAVSYLRGLILKYNFLRRRHLAFLRAAAFEALTLNEGEKAETALVRLAGNWRIGIRRMARDAMHQRRINLYGESE